MKKCLQCGHEAEDSLNFCGYCGASLGQESGGRSDGGRTADAERKKEKREKRIASIRRVFSGIVMPALAAFVSLVLFVSGFFINIDYYPAEQVQAQFNLISGDTDISAVLEQTPVEQNVFNVFGALFTGKDAEKIAEKQQEIQQKLSAKLQNVMQDYGMRIAELSLAAEAGDSGVVAELFALYEEIADDYASELAGINLIQSDVIAAELALSRADGSMVGGDSSARVDKWVADTYFRTGIMTVYVFGYIYLLAISLLYLYGAVIGFVRHKENTRGGKFFLMYLLGCFAMLAAGQLTATSLNAVGIFCFVFAAAAALVYYAMRVFCTYKFDAKSIVALSVKGVSAIFCFAVLCVLMGNIYDFGVAVDKIGAVFGMYVFGDAYGFSEGVAITLRNFFAVTIPYLAVCAFTAILFFRQMRSVWENGADESLLWFAAPAGFALAQMIVLFACTEAGAVALVETPGAAFTVFLLLAAVAVCCVAGGALSKELSQKADGGSEAGGEGCVADEGVPPDQI